MGEPTEQMMLVLAGMTWIVAGGALVQNIYLCWIVRNWYDKAQEKSGEMKQLAQNMGEQARQPGVQESGQWPTGGYPQGGGLQGGGGPVPADKRPDAEGG